MNCASPTMASATGLRVMSYTCQATTTACICWANMASMRASTKGTKALCARLDEAPCAAPSARPLAAGLEEDKVVIR